VNVNINEISTFNDNEIRTLDEKRQPLFRPASRKNNCSSNSTTQGVQTSQVLDLASV
jgi:hypothetical protein